MIRRFGLLITVVGAILLACAGVVMAQQSSEEEERTSSEERTRPAASSQQSAVADVIPGQYIVVLEDGGSREASAQGSNRKREAEEVANALVQENKVEEVVHTYGSALKGFAGKIPEDKVDEVRSDPRVELVAEDREAQAFAQTLPTGVERVRADDSNTADIDGIDDRVNVDIAILDTGIFTKHADLNIAGGKDCSNDGKNTYSDDQGHGTHVAGSAAAKDDATGVVGVAPGARLWAVKVLDKTGSGTWGDIICGIDWVTQNASTIEVANMSLGSKFTTNGTADDNNCGNSTRSGAALQTADAVHRAICSSITAGVTYAVAAGNSTEDVSNFVPASFNEPLTVSALADYNGEPGGGASNTCNFDPAQDDDFAFFSNFATTTSDRAHMIAAPGACIYSTYKGSKKKKKGAYKVLQGTSMASPHVAGGAALFKSNNPSAAPITVKNTLLSDANREDVGEGHTDIFNLNPEPLMLTHNY